ncbi:hypothetical protein EZS27_005308 [termite gut metagenome]|uniref:BACON domain-containing protein n=1 Tax=termite gut metagenome TaxID=433724 RepID=A0A5J4SP96_9ZZZZ
MKKNSIYWQMLAGVFPLLFLGLGCDSTSDEPDPFLQVSKTDILFTAEEDEANVAVETNYSKWTVLVDTDGEGWCLVKKDEKRIIISVLKNEGFVERSTTVSVEGKGVKAEISVTQEGKSAFLEINTESVVKIQTAGGKATVSIDTNLLNDEWDFELNDETALSDWCVIEKGDAQLDITVKPNPGVNERSVAIAFTSKWIEDEIDRVVTLTQFGKALILQIAPGSGMKAFESTGGQDYVNVVTNLSIDEWEYLLSDEDASEWCHVTKSEEDDKLIINVDPNTGTSVRNVEITMTADKIDAAKYPKIAVMQAGVPTSHLLQVEGSTWHFQATGGSETVNIKTLNIPADKWGYKLSNNSSASSSSWCEVTKIADNQLKIQVSANKEAYERSIDITVTSDLVTAEQQPKFTVKQAAAGSSSDPFLTIQPADKTISLAAAAITKTINVDTNISDWSVSVDNASWCTVTKGTGTLAISASKNEGAARTAKVTVKAGSNPSLNVEITVNQAAATSGSDPGETINTNFSISGYEGQTLEVAFVDNNTPGSLTLDASGNGVLATTHTQALTIKSIKATGGSAIWIGRKETSGEIKLAVNSTTHAVQWRTKTGDAATALIGTAAELLLKFNASSTVTTYEFEADIDLMDQPWTPVTSTFSKTIDGQHHKIYNLNVDFGDLTTPQGGIVSTLTGTIKNLHIASGEITMASRSGSSTTNYGGVLVGYLSGTGEIIGCSNAANITSQVGYIGGICGWANSNTSKIIGCVNFGNINGKTGNRVGGIVNSNSSTITACYNTGAITGGQYTGGVSGYTGSGANFYATYNKGKINSTNGDRGAVSGRYSAGAGEAVNCYYDTNSCDKEPIPTIKPFSSGNWPKSDDSNWGIGDGTIAGNYWKNLGSWNEGTPTYPALYWE